MKTFVLLTFTLLSSLLASISVVSASSIRRRMVNRPQDDGEEAKALVPAQNQPATEDKRQKRRKLCLHGGCGHHSYYPSQSYYSSYGSYGSYYPYGSSYYNYGPTTPNYYYDYYPTLPDIPTTAIENGMFTTLVAALTATDLVGALSAPNGPFTVFAPTDEAFAALPAGLLDCLLADPATLTDILLYHVAEGTVTSDMLSNGMMIPTLQGEMSIVTLGYGGVFINEAEVILPDVMASNGVIHVIDSVLVPPSVDVNAYLSMCYYGGHGGHYYKPHAYSF